MQNNLPISNPPMGQQTLFQMLKNELSFKDIGKIMGVLLTGLGGGLLQGAAFTIILTSGWLLSQTLLGTVVIPALAKAGLGIAQKLFPAVIAPYAAQIIIGFFAFTFLFPFVSQGIKSLFAEPKRNEVEGISLLDLGYYLTAWVLPIALFCINASHGVSISANLTTTGWVSGMMGASVALITSGQEYLNEFMVRVNQRMSQSIPQSLRQPNTPSQSSSEPEQKNDKASTVSKVADEALNKQVNPVLRKQNLEKQTARQKAKPTPAKKTNSRLGNKQSHAAKKTPESKVHKRKKP